MENKKLLVQPINGTAVRCEGPVNGASYKGKMMEPEGPMSKQLRVLVVDDQKNMRTIMRMIVKEMGHGVETAENGAEALELYRKGGIDLVITDFKMPRMNGLELLKAIKRENGKVPVIVVTSLADEMDKRPFVEAGAFQVLGKPFDNVEIENAISIAVN